MGRIYRLIFTLFIVAFLASCTQSIRSSVTRFHQLPKPNGEKIVIVPANPANNGSLEFANYATLVGNALGSFGYVPANGGEADLVVELDYGVDQGQQRVRVSPSMTGFFHYGSYYGRYFNPWFPYRNPYLYYGGFNSPYFYHPGIYDPFGYYPLSTAPSVRSYTIYSRHLKMVIKPNKEGAMNLYEGEVKSTGRNNMLHEVMPYMVQAFFANFPGESGASENISIEVPET